MAKDANKNGIDICNHKYKKVKHNYDHERLSEIDDNVYECVLCGKLRCGWKLMMDKVKQREETFYIDDYPFEYD